jgi:acyl-CoA thioesterase FadM
MARAQAWRDVLGMPDEPSFILAEATVRYASAAMIGEALEIEMRTGEIRNKAWVWEYVIRCVDDGRTVAEGKTVQVWFDYAVRKSVAIPEEMRAALSAIG